MKKKFGDCFYITLLSLLLFGCSKKDGQLLSKPDKMNDLVSVISRNDYSNTHLRDSILDDLQNLTYHERMLVFPKLVQALLSKNDSIGAKSIFQFYYSEVNSLGTAQDLSIFYNEIGYFYLTKKKDSAYYYFKKSYDYLSEDLTIPNVQNRMAKLCYEMATIRERGRDYNGAQSLSIQSLNHFKKVGELENYFFPYNLVGVALNGLNDFDGALQYHLKAKEFIPYASSDLRDRFFLTNKNNIASLYARSSKPANAFDVYLELLQENNIGNYPSLYAKALVGYSLNGALSGMLDQPQALDSLEKSTSIFEDLASNFDLSNNYWAQAKIFEFSNDIVNTILAAKKSLDLAEESNNYDRKLEALEILMRWDNANASSYSDDYIQLNKKMQLEERELRNQFTKIDLDTQEIKERNKILSKQKQIFAGITLSVLISGLAFFTIISQRIRNQNLLFLQKQSKTDQEVLSLMLSQQGKLEEGKKMEQKRISEELHDSILSDMLGIRLVLLGLNDKNDPESIAHRTHLLIKLQEIEEEVRMISHELNMKSKSKIDNFIASLKNLFQEYQQSFKVRISFDLNDEVKWVELEEVIKVNTYRIIQESVLNALKHAKGTHINVILDVVEQNLQIQISDNGIGIMPKPKGGIGLKNIKSRIARLGGIIQIIGKPQKGTKIKVSIPLHNKPVDENNSSSNKVIVTS